MSANEFATDARPDFVRPDKFRKNAPVPVPVPVPIPYPSNGANRGRSVRSYGTDVTPTIRALRSRANSHAMKKTTTKIHDDATTRRLMVVMREVLARERFESIPDFVEAVKCRCGQLRVPWTPTALARACYYLEVNHALPEPHAPRSSAPLRAHDYIPRLSRLEAAALVRRLLDVTGKTLRAMR
jgi:hypothetical protein